MLKFTMRNKYVAIAEFITIFAIVFTLLGFKDLVVDTINRGDNYEVKFVQDENVDKQEVYRLYRNDKYVEDVDYNKYNLVDEDGKTDVKYCYMVSRIKEFAAELFIGIILIVAAGVFKSLSKGSPFTKANVIRMKAISLLMLGFSIVPGMIGFLMTFIRFSYVNATMKIEWFYMFLVACAVALICHVFEYGVKLQDDVDSIV